MELDVLNINLDILPSEMGKLMPKETAGSFQKGICEFCFMKDKVAFPGSQPVSMSKKNWGLIKKDEYVVCEKSDGVRYLLLFYNYKMYYIDRRFNIYLSTMQPFTKEQFPACLDPERFSLFDGEMIIEKSRLSEGEKPYICYWVFDLLVINNYCVFRNNLYQRLYFISTLFTNPFQELYPKNDFFPFKIALKPMYHIASSEYIWTQIVGKVLKHESDGLIYTPVALNYTPFTCKKLLKWKPAELNSVDFQMYSIQKSDHTFYRLYSSKGGISSPFDWIMFTDDEISTYAHDGLVLECVRDHSRYTFHPIFTGNEEVTPDPQYNDPDKGLGWSKGGWKPIRVRKDKSVGNDIKVVKGLLDCINDDISFKELIAHINKI
ncbi:hypothetical protein WA158_005603 [Blastocystis sp. Blastoise]